jgi:hypothetical protein
MMLVGYYNQKKYIPKVVFPEMRQFPLKIVMRLGLLVV